MSVGSWINSVRSWLNPAASLARRIPGRVWLAIGLLLVGLFWLDQHDARIRRQVQLQQLQQQTSAKVATLKKQAEQEIAKANVANAHAIQKLEARRRQIAQQNRQLAAQLNALRKQEQIQVGQVATLPLSEIATRVATQLGLQAADVAEGSSADIAQNATSAPPADAVATKATSGGGDTAATKATALTLTASAARKVETALVELKSCRAESNVQTRQVSSYQARATADDAVIQRQAGSISSLNQALKAKEQILSQQQNEYKAELRVARGTFWSRVAHVAKHVAIGVAVGVVIGVAAR